jgi:uncharacterized protein YdhG (YjbR/CyaY superfamily)
MTDIESYINNFDLPTQKRLHAIREIIEKFVPDAVGKISYGMPAYKFRKITLYFGAYKEHIGMYPIYRGSSIKESLEPYRATNVKDGLRFKHNHPLPLDLIKQIIEEKWPNVETESSS